MPTVLSGFACILALKIKFTASACAPNRVGVKSPFRVCSELSTLQIYQLCEQTQNQEWRGYIIIVASRPILKTFNGDRQRQTRIAYAAKLQTGLDNHGPFRDLPGHSII